MNQSIDKQQIHAAVLAALKDLVENARAATLRAYETATHEENIAENKYDTLGLEAAYLAQGQARRLAECEADLIAFQNLTPRTFTQDDAVAVGALIQLEDEDGETQFLLLGPAAGGLKITWNGLDIVVITPHAPLGKALLRAAVGDEIAVTPGAKQKRYEVIAIH